MGSAYRWLRSLILWPGVAAFAILMTYEGVLVTLRASDRSPVLLLPMSCAYAALPLSGAAIVLFAGRILMGLFARLAEGGGLAGAGTRAEVE